MGGIAAIARERVALNPDQPDPHLALHRARRVLLARLLESVTFGANLVQATTWLGLSVHGLPESPLPSVVLMMVLHVTMVAVVVGPLAYFLPRLVRVQDAVRSVAGADDFGTRAAGWRLGGLIYFAPDDPALFVPKRIGIGQTVNLARPAAWALLAALLLAPALIAWLVTGC